MGSDSHMYTLLMRRNYYIKRSYDWYHRRVWCQHLLCTEKKMSTSTVTRTTSSSNTSLGDWLEEEGVVVKDEETLTESSLSPTVESVIVDPFETLVRDSLHNLITSLLTKFETEVLVVISVLAVLSLLFTSVRKRVLRLVGCGRRPLQQPPQEDNEVEEKEEEEEEETIRL